MTRAGALSLSLLSLYLSPSLSQWVTPAGPPSAQSFVGTTPDATSRFVCRGATAAGDVPGTASVAAGGGAFAPGCAVSYNKNVAVAVPALLLRADARLGWWGGLPPGLPGVAFELAGTLNGTEPQYVCRGRPAGVGGAPLAGVSNLLHQVYDQLGDVGPVCLVASGALVLPTFVPGTLMAGLGTFEFLVRTPPGTTAADYAPSGVAPAVVFGPTPSNSPTPSFTPSATPSVTPSPSSTPSVQPFYTTLWFDPSEALTLTNLTTFYAGMEADGYNAIYVCAGFVPTADPNVLDILPGKYEVNFGRCNVPFNITEFPDAQYRLLRASPWLMWSTAIAPAPNASSAFPFRAPAKDLAPVMEGGLRGVQHYVCRAWYTLPSGYWPYASGPHSGYTDALPAGAPVCRFPYGGGVVTTTTFDLLWSAPSYLSPSAATNLSGTLPVVPKPGASASRTPSFTRTPSPSPSPTPSPLPPQAVVWTTVSGYRSAHAAPTRYVTAGVDADGSSPTALCRSVAGEAAALEAARAAAAAGNASLQLPLLLPTPGAFQTLWDSCRLPRAGATGALTRTELLLAQPYISWATPAVIAAALPDAQLIAYAGASAANPTGVNVTQSQADFAASPSPLAICRAFHPASRAGPYSGLFNASALYDTAASAAGGAAVPCAASRPGCAPGCLFNSGVGAPGSNNALTLVTGSYQLLYLLPARLTRAQAGNWSGGLVIPTPSTTATTSATPSPSLTPATPGLLQWIRAPLKTWPDVFVGGVENGKPLYVCRAYNDTLRELMPGKTWSDVNYCNVALRGHEVVDQVYEVLRANVALAWVPRVLNGTLGCGPRGVTVGGQPCAPPVVVPPPAGSQPVIAGVVDDLPAQPCRAAHPGVPAAQPPAFHPGYTDGQVYNGVPLCFFSYGGGIVRTAPFDVLVVLANVSPSATPSAARTPSRTPSGTPSPTPRATTTASSTPSPSPSPPASLSAGASPSNTPSPSNTASASATASGTPCPSASAAAGAGGDASASASAAAAAAAASASASATFSPVAAPNPGAGGAQAGGAGAGAADAMGTQQVAALVVGLVLVVALGIWRWYGKLSAMLGLSQAGASKGSGGAVELKDEEDRRAPVAVAGLSSARAGAGAAAAAPAAAAAAAAVAARPASSSTPSASSSAGIDDDAWATLGSGRIAPGAVDAEENPSGGRRDAQLSEW